MDKPKAVNLYWVSVNYEYGYYVFAESRNKAKALCVHYNDDDEEYTDMRCWTRVKDVNSECNGSVIDSEDHELYPYVKSLGFEFREPEEW